MARDNVIEFASKRAALNFELASGGAYSIPLARSLTVSEVMSLRGGSEEAIIAFLDRHAPGLTDEVTYDELGEIMALWRDASEPSAGESLASSTS